MVWLGTELAAATRVVVEEDWPVADPTDVVVTVDVSESPSPPPDVHAVTTKPMTSVRRTEYDIAANYNI